MHAGNRRTTQTQTFNVRLNEGDEEYLHLRGNGNLLNSDRIISITAFSVGDKQRKSGWPFGPQFEIRSWNENKYKFENIGLNSGWFSNMALDDGGNAVNTAGTHYLSMIPFVGAGAYGIIKSIVNAIGISGKIFTLVTSATQIGFALMVFKTYKDLSLSFLPFWKNQPELLKINSNSLQGQDIQITVKYRRITKDRHSLIDRLLSLGL